MERFLYINREKRGEGDMKDKKLLSAEEQAQMELLETELHDERNILLGNAAKARAYELMMILYAAAITALAILGMISAAAFFILLGIFAICQCRFIFCLKKYHKEQ